MKQSKENSDAECGFGQVGKMKNLQCCASLMAFTIFYCPSALFTSALNMYIASQITTMEKYFGFNSGQSGFLLSCNDIGFLLTVLLVSFFARKVHIPRVLACSTILYGLSGVGCAFAYFLAPERQELDLEHPQKENGSIHQGQNSFNGLASPMCQFNEEMDNATQICDLANMKIGAPTSFSQVALGIVGVGMILQGIGKSPRQSYITTYIDDNGNKEKTAVYVGIISAVGILGPGIGFGLGGVFSRQYVTLKDVPISVDDPRWIGAWWLGFLFFGSLALCVALPLLCFPKRLVPKKAVHQSKGKDDLPAVQKLLIFLKEFLSSIARLLLNGRYICNLGGVTLNLLAVSGIVAFNAKYLENVFSVPTWFANMIMGATTLIGAALGVFIGGFVTSHYKLSPLSCIKCATFVQISVVLLTALGFVLGCPNPEIVGFNIKLHETNTTWNTAGAASSCNQLCHCKTGDFFPVCGKDNKNYFSPCYAGCTQSESQLYRNCSCIGSGETATPGLCESDCNMLWPYVIVTIIGAILSTFIIIPSLIFQIRCVSEKDKSMAVGIASFFQTLLGWLPGPVLVGKIIDTCCSIWTNSCIGQGACVFYDIETLRIRKHIFDVVCRSIVVILFILAWMFSRNKTDWSLSSPDVDVPVTQEQKALMSTNTEERELKSVT